MRNSHQLFQHHTKSSISKNLMHKEDSYGTRMTSVNTRRRDSVSTLRGLTQLDSSILTADTGAHREAINSRRLEGREGASSLPPHSEVEKVARRPPPCTMEGKREEQSTMAAILATTMATTRTMTKDELQNCPHRNRHVSSSLEVGAESADRTTLPSPLSLVPRCPLWLRNWRARSLSFDQWFAFQLSLALCVWLLTSSLRGRVPVWGSRGLGLGSDHQGHQHQPWMECAGWQE